MAAASKRQNKSKKETRKVRFELSTAQLTFWALGLTAALVWMFVFGIFIGRGLPIGTAQDGSFKAQVIHFLGLDHQPEKPADHAAETWDSPEKIVQSLTYYDDLTRGHGEDGHTRPEQLAPQPPSEPENSQLAASPPPAATSPYYTIMVASLKSQENARNLVKQLKENGYSPRAETVEMAEGEVWHRVLIGRFENRSDAQAFAAKFNQRQNARALVIQISP